MFTKRPLLLLVLVSVLCSTGLTQEPPKAKQKQQFLIVLKLIPHLLDDKNWTERENQLVAKHFARLKELLKDGKLVLAGRTTTNDPKQMGLIVVETDSEEEARQIMQNDDAVSGKIMTAELFPFTVALRK